MKLTFLLLVIYQQLFVATTLQEAFNLVISALQVESAVFVVDSKSNLSH
jgi:hypothetical protein